MKRLAFILALAASPACAQFEFTLTNGLLQTITGVNTYPLNDNGAPIEDNIGGFFDPLAPGDRATFALDSTDCEKVLMVVSIADRPDFRPIIDLCVTTAVTIRN